MYIPANKETTANNWLSKNLEDKKDARYPRLHCSNDSPEVIRRYKVSPHSTCGKLPKPDLMKCHMWSPKIIYESQCAMD